ncbi:hypothetical protein C8Q77DRAFT_1160156 [Trametes polyzona]|nr:hypothetical protein C8Q77DRAFT_1160156 [Trametes polyzona]
MSSKSSAIPLSVQRLIDMVPTTLPESIKNQTSSMFCNDVWKLYVEFCRAADAATFQPDASFRDDELEYVQDLLVTVLHQVALLKDWVPNEEQPRIVLSEVVTLLLVLLRRAFSEYEIHTSALFAVARQPQAGRKPPVPRLYRTAEIIVRPVTNQAISESSSRSASPLESIVESNTAEEAYIDKAAADTASDDTSEDRATSSEDDVSDDESLDSSDSPPNVVRCLRRTVGTPHQLLHADDLEPQQPIVACVAHVDTIAHLMTSALLHRLAMGVAGPLFGLSFDKFRPTVQIHVAWLDEVIEEGNDLPLVHSLPEGCIPPLDLREPLSAVRLALFIRRLADQERDRGTFCEEQGRPLPWRADREEDSMPSHADYSRADCISMWAAHVYHELSECPDDDDDTMAPKKQGTKKKRIDTAMPSNKSTPAKGAGSSKDSQSSVQDVSSPEQSTLDHSTSAKAGETDDSSQVDDRSENVHVGETPVPSDTPAPGGPDRDDSKSHMSSSTFVGKETSSGMLHTQRYFATRGVVFCSAREGGFIPDGRARPVQYMLATVPVWFRVQAQTIRKDLCTESDKIYQELLAAHAQQADTFIGPMTPRVEAVVRASLCPLLRIISTLRALDGGPNAPLVHNEATYRAQWDQLLDVVVRASGEVDIAYQKEAKLRYPEYNNAGCACQSDEYEVMMSKLLPFAPRSSQERARFNYWYLGFHEKVDPVEEPLSGTADGIIYLRIADAFGSQGIANEVNIWQPETRRATPESETFTADDDDGSAFRQYAHNAFRWGRQRKLFSAQEQEAYAQQMSLGGPPDAYSLRTVDHTASPQVGASTTDIHGMRQPPAPSTTSRPAIKNCLYIPLVACEFKRLLKGWTAAKATDQERLYLTAICTFMRMFNITRFPIFGIITTGPHGVISCAWSEPVDVSDDKKMEAVFIADQEAVQVDLREPIDALNVATFVAYIALEHGPRLRELFSRSVDGVDQSLKRYLLKEQVSPFEQARCKTMKDGQSWHKPRSQKGIDKGTGAGRTGKKSSKASVGKPPDLPPITEEHP